MEKFDSKEYLKNILVFNDDVFDSSLDTKVFNEGDKVEIINGLNKNKNGVIFRIDYGDFGYGYNHYQYIVRFGNDENDYVYIPYKYNQLKYVGTTKRVTIIFEDYKDGKYNEIERITSDDFEHISEETACGNLKIVFMIYRGRND